MTLEQIYLAAAKLDSAAREMHVACHYAAGGKDDMSANYRAYARRELAAVASLLGYTLTPVVEPVQPAATAEALFDGVPV
jgi:hypothetical protein